MRRNLILVLLLCLLPLLAGALVYVCFRPGGLLGYAYPLPQPIVLQPLFGVLPDLLWSFSLANALFLYQRSRGSVGTAWRVAVFLLLLGQEWIQLLFPEYFRFDWWDLAASVFAYFLSILIMHLVYPPNRHI